MTHSYHAVRHERAVSPVVGVMLMLVVVIIIAAVVSNYSGSLISTGTNKKAPTLTMDVKVVNTGYWQGSGFFATVTGVSDPIPTKDIKIVTSWKEKTLDSMSRAVVMVHEKTTLPSNPNINVLLNPGDTLSDGFHAAPFGNGPGVNGTEGVDVLRGYSAPGQQFGNYTLMQGTALSAKPAGAADADSVGSSSQSSDFGGYGASNASYDVTVKGTPGTTTTYYWIDDPDGEIYPGECNPPDTSMTNNYEMDSCFCGTDVAQCNSNIAGTTSVTLKSNSVTTGGTPDHTEKAGGSPGTKYQYTLCLDNCIDPAKAVLGSDWNKIRWGDTVNVKVIHIPTGKVIFQQDVPVTEE